MLNAVVLLLPQHCMAIEWNGLRHWSFITNDHPKRVQPGDVLTFRGGFAVNHRTTNFGNIAERTMAHAQIFLTWMRVTACGEFIKHSDKIESVMPTSEPPPPPLTCIMCEAAMEGQALDTYEVWKTTPPGKPSRRWLDS